jgi:hypothetical protein
LVQLASAKIIPAPMTPFTTDRVLKLNSFSSEGREPSSPAGHRLAQRGWPGASSHVARKGEQPAYI